MTQVVYDKYHHDIGYPRYNPKHANNTITDLDYNYDGKHEYGFYNVWRVLGPAGPEEEVTVYGYEAAKESIVGCWDWEVTNTKGERVL